MNRKVITITPAAASFATPYSIGDVIGVVLTLTDAVANLKDCANLVSLVVLDKANQKSAVDLVFFDTAPVNSIGADNAAYALNDSDLQFLVGRITVAAADYVSSDSTNAEATLKNLQLIMQAAAGSRNLYCAVISRGAPTYGSASDLSIKLAFEQ